MIGALEPGNLPVQPAEAALIRRTSERFKSSRAAWCGKRLLANRQVPRDQSARSSSAPRLFLSFFMKIGTRCVVPQLHLQGHRALHQLRPISYVAASQGVRRLAFPQAHDPTGKVRRQLPVTWQWQWPVTPEAGGTNSPGRIIMITARVTHQLPPACCRYSEAEVRYGPCRGLRA